MTLIIGINLSKINSSRCKSTRTVYSPISVSQSFSFAPKAQQVTLLNGPKVVVTFPLWTWTLKSLTCFTYSDDDAPPLFTVCPTLSRVGPVGFRSVIFCAFWLDDGWDLDIAELLAGADDVYGAFVRRLSKWLKNKLTVKKLVMHLQWIVLRLAFRCYRFAWVCNHLGNMIRAFLNPFRVKVSRSTVEFWWFCWFSINLQNLFKNVLMHQLFDNLLPSVLV